MYIQLTHSLRLAVVPIVNSSLQYGFCSVGLSPHCFIMVCSNESPGYDGLRHRPGNKARDWPAGDEAFLRPVSIPGGCMCVCVFLLVCMCVRVAAAVFSLILRHIVWRSQQRSTFYPPHSLARLPTRSGGVQERNLCCLRVLSGFSSASRK